MALDPHRLIIILSTFVLFPHMTLPSNNPDSLDAAVALLFHVEDHWRRAIDLDP
jgi:hypothetical protein